MPHKSIDGRASDLLTHFAQREPPTFTSGEAFAYLNTDPPVGARILATLVNRGWITRHLRGVYEVAPLWSSPNQPFDPDRFAAIARWAREPYYVGFRSALEIRDWLDHPVRGRLWIVVPTSRHTPSTFRDRVIWVVMRGDRFSWGRERHWVGSSTIWVSDAERTVLDGLHLPRHIGGISEVVLLLARIWPQVDGQRLISYSEKLGIDSVRRRLGWVLELTDRPGARALASLLKDHLSSRRSPILLDPSLPPGGFVDSRWGVEVNLDVEELREAGST
jgi:predicted transcriptional regulator of viral defense system